MEKLWIDALDFDDYGGFVKETQFVREMGQGYLLVNGVGTPVKPASVKFRIEEDGWHRFYVRTKNWCVGYDPDGIVLAVDGVKYDHVCSQMQTEQWYFEVGADFELTKGEHTLEVYDTTGWCGRFAAVVITNDYDFTPSPEITRWKQQRAEMKGLKKSVTDHGHYDLLIAGGGVPGVTAAITAARLGLKVALLSDRPVLGGNGSSEGSVTVGGSENRGYHETGVIYEMKVVRHEEKTNWSVVFQRFVDAEPNISLFSNTLLDDAECDGNVIKSVHAISTLDLSEHTFSADQYIDDTGDGWLGYYAGAAYHVGRESRLEFNEPNAPEAADGNTMSGCNTATVTGFDHTISGYSAEYADEEVKFTPPAWAYKLPEGDDLARTPRLRTRGQWWLENRNTFDNLWDKEYTRDELVRLVVGYFNWLKNSWPGRDEVKTLKLTELAYYYAQRESRRLIGDFVMGQMDYRNPIRFEDSVGYIGWGGIDVHHIKGIFSGKEGLSSLHERISLTPFPFRCLYSKNIENLMMVGRCISVTHLGLGPARVMQTCATMGQATATAAMLCKKYGQTPRQVGKEHMDELQQLLLKDGMAIVGVTNHDPEDLARTTIATADSWEGVNVPSCVINGRARATDGEPHAWISKGELPQSLVLSFAEPTEIHEVRLTLEIPFDRYGGGIKGYPSMDELLKEFTIEIKVGDTWKCIRKEENNIQRLIITSFPPEKVTAVRVNAIKATGMDKAIIPEIRIY